MIPKATDGGFGPAPAPPLELLAGRREALLSSIGDGVAVIPSAPALLRSRDTDVQYRQNSDLYYLTGFPEPEAVAVISPHAAGKTLTLFVRERSPEREVWDGGRVGVERAGEAYGADEVHPISELQKRLPALLRAADRVHFPVGLVPSLDALVQEAIVAARRGRQRTGSGPTGLVDLELSTGPMRLVKDGHEIERMRIAGRIAAAGHRSAIERAAPGVGEWEIQAALEGTMRALGADGPSFLSIVAAGPSATTLHYVDNRNRVGPDDLVLVDAGAEWGMYCSDITRTFPASGRFTGVQRDLYEVVLAAEEAGIAAAIPGAPVSAVHDAAVRVLVRGMLDHGLLPAGEVDGAIESGAFKRFYMHQSSHWLGLDVHDVGMYAEGGAATILRAGMVLTVEPGLYIPAVGDDVPAHLRGIGIRIEDDVLVTEAGNELLTREVPVDAAAIEALRP